MKRITKATLWVLPLAGLAGLATFGVPGLVKADDDAHTFSFDVACDCRTGAAPDGQVRGGPFVIQGKIFPSGTLPAGIDSMYPTDRANSVGDWLCRGQSGGGAIPSAYAATPSVLNTQYYILSGPDPLHPKAALTLEGYEIITNAGESSALSITGGTGGYSGAAGDVTATGLGTNKSGCPNFRARFSIRRGD